ncbi:MAG TPA: MFS transporter [Candidatus Aphodovivens avistercoris]|nr:MFS transporter [Candidatus Aphodovivens avistercoris]
MSPPTLSKGRLWASLAVILFGQFVVSIDLTVLNIALPDLTQELNPTSDQLLWIVDVYSLVLAGLIVATSSLSDQFGRKRMLLGGFALFGIGSALIMIADAPEHVIAIRAFLGVGGAMIMSVTISMVRSIFTDPKERALAVALWSAVSALGMATGPLIGGFLLDHFSWHAAFLVNVPFMAVAALVGIFKLPEVKVAEPGKFDALGAVMFLAGMVSLLWGIKHVSAELEFDTAGIVTIVAGLVLLVLFGVKCVKSKTPMLELSLFRNRTFAAGVVATAGSTFAMAVLLYLLSQWLQLVNGDGSLEAGLKLVPMAIASLVASTAASALAMRFQARNVIAGGMIIAAAAMIMLVLFRDDLTIEPIMVSMTLVGLGTGALAVGASLIMGATPVEKASGAGSTQEISYDMGNVLGVAILGSVASIIYRDGLSTGQMRAMGLGGQLIDACEQSFSVTAEVANQLQMPDLYQLGVEAFNNSVVDTCLIGGIIILVVAVAVWALVPKGLKITEDVDTP